MGEAVALAGFVSGFIALVVGWRRARIRQSVLDRLAEVPRTQEEPEIVELPRLAPFVRRHWLLPWMLGALIAAGLHWWLNLHWVFALLGGAIVGLLGGVWDAIRITRASALIESQLANAIDLMVGALRAGASLPAAIESALSESKPPLRHELEEVLGRLRLGDDPRSVFNGLMARVPLETFRLFSATLATHWEVGGSLAPTLATVGRTIRDRIEVSRRIRSLTTQSRVSTIAILGATYFIALVMWRNDPMRMQEFLATDIGRTLVAGSILLQAIGIVWATQIGKVRY
jgi:Flp pilus assembly protein TadB